jgi:hypothetical protein
MAELEMGRMEGGMGDGRPQRTPMDVGKLSAEQKNSAHHHPNNLCEMAVQKLNLLK